MKVEVLGQFWAMSAAGMELAGRLAGELLFALHDPLAVRLPAAALLFAAGGSIIWFLTRRIWPAHRMILMASKAVEGTADQVAFTASFPRFDRAINEIALLRRPWAQYRVGIIIPPQSARAPIRHNLRAGDYLHLEALEAGGFKFRFFKSWASFVFGLGVLFTLLGITLDVHFASIASITDATAWNGLLARLAGNMLPMLSGAGSGLALAMAFHWAEHRLKWDMLRLSAALEQKIKFSAARPVAEQHLQLTGAVGAAPDNALDMQALPEQLRELSQEIVAALARVETQMTQTMPGRIGDAMQPLSEALDMLGKRLSESNAEALRQAVSELAQGLHARAAEDLDALSGALAQARNGLEDAGLLIRDASIQASEKMSDAGLVWREASSHASERLSGAGEGLAEQIGRASQQAQLAFGPLPKWAAEFGEVLERFNEGVSRHGDAVAAAAETALRAISAMDEILARPRETAPPAIYAAMPHAAAPAMDFMVAEDISRAARDISSSLEAVSEARRLLKRLSSRLKQPATSLLAQDWEWRREEPGESSAESDEVLDEVLENFRAGASQQRAGLDAAIEELETRLEHLFRHLDTGASRLDGALQMMRRQAMTPPADSRNTPAADPENESAAR